ncbi:MAG: carboxypeptidase regulatory-like domain-containing protein [Acidobacteria bacterium]|nr:carboxypeptidase regulatory-like domain-containing protein [Acidobacteriota bacterium]
MRVTLFPVLVVCLLCAFSAAGQNVIEPISTAAVHDGKIIAELVVESPAGRSVEAWAELLDQRGAVQSSSSARLQPLSAGRQKVVFEFPLAIKQSSENSDITWYRLHYKIGDATGIISLSQMIADLFELRIIAAERVAAGMNYRVRVRSLHPFTGQPAAGVGISTKIVLDLKTEEDRQLEISGTGMTNADGFAVLDFTVPPEAMLDGDGEVYVTGYKNGIVREAQEDIGALTDDIQILTITDKPIYQPEQTVNIRGILLKGGEAKTVLGNSVAEFRITDEDDTLLFREKVESSPFGIVSAAWQIPAGVRLGDYRIEIRDGSGETLASERVKVTRYDLPNFVVNAKAEKAYYLPKDKKIEVEVKADYLFGKPVQKGKVRIVEEKSREWNWREQKYETDEGQVREGELDAEGRFKVKFDQTVEFDDDEDDWPRYRDIKFAAYVTDASTNRTEQRRFDVRVSREPIHVYFVGNAWNVPPGLPIEGYISTFYADGTPAECEIEILASPDDKNRYRPVGVMKTNSYGAGKLSLRRPNVGGSEHYVDLRFKARDSSGKTGTLFEREISFDDDDNYIRITPDKAIYKPGDEIDIRVETSIKRGMAYVDVVRGLSVVDSRFVQIKDGRGRLRIPYRTAFKGVLTLAAFIEDPDDTNELAGTARGIIFPARQGINVEASFDKAQYKPNEDVKLDIDVKDIGGNALESALGVVVVDRAVEERARTDAEFGGVFSKFGGWLGYGPGFGSVNIKDINELDLRRPISPELQLVAEVILHDAYYDPNVFRSKSFYDEPGRVFAGWIREQFVPIEDALRDAYEKRNYLHPTDDAGLRSILGGNGLDVDTFRDPWGVNYRTSFTIDQKQNVLTFTSAGPDKAFETNDDFVAFRRGFEYFTPTGKQMDAAVQAYFDRTGDHLRSEQAIYDTMGVPELRDRWGNPYRFVFETEGRWMKISVRSAGRNGKFDDRRYGDDFIVWQNRVDYFAPIEKRISEAQMRVRSVPMNEAELKAQLAAAGIIFDELRDGAGKPLYVTAVRTSRFWDRVTVENVQKHGEKGYVERRTVTPVTQEIMQFTIRGNGRDGIRGNWDDVTLMQFVHVLSERAKDDPQPVPVMRPASYLPTMAYSTGSIAGTVTDSTGAVLPGAKVTATNDVTKVDRADTTNANGSYFLSGLPAGTYTLKVTAMGFKDTVISAVAVTANSTTRANVSLEVGDVSMTVEVVSASETLISTTDASISNSVTSRQILGLPRAANFQSLLKLTPGAADQQRQGEAPVEGDRESEQVFTIDGKEYVKDENGKLVPYQPKATPRLREYFPETLLWSPEVMTDKDGKASIRFRMADNITTWKMYTIASTKDGKIGTAEKEVAAFQSFFVDLDPPKFLTDGDEIHLPTQVRNYTDAKQKVDVTMAKADWFSFLDADKKEVEVASGETQNAVFGFKAAMPIKDGRQRVTAMAETDSDAIEKPVTVRPDGREVVATDSRYLTGSDRIDVNFPANSLPNARSASLKIYPNLMAHVAESVEGLLMRPYGCGEQTISSTYPNLMILKFAGNGSSRRIPAATERRAMKHLQSGYDRLLGYQSADGGFMYWGGRGTSDLALTAYALRFLSDAAGFVPIDPDVVRKAEAYLVSQQRADGSWNTKHQWEQGEDRKRAKMLTSYVSRTLAMLQAARNDKKDSAMSAALTKALGYLRNRNLEIDDPYSLALLGLAAHDADEAEIASAVTEKLAVMGIEENNGTYWNLESNTAFNGWGTAGRIETTALVTQLLLKQNAGRKYDDLLGRAMIFLLRNKDRYGVWYSTQTTINVLDTFVASLSEDGGGTQTVDVILNGERIERIEIGPDKLDQIVIGLNDRLGEQNVIELRSSDRTPLMAQAVSTHYIGWQDADASGRTVNQSRALELDYKCDRTDAAIMQEVSCSVSAERVGFRGYGMLLAEIGTPPGADVSRESLEAALDADWSISKYEVLPDRIIVYMWAKAGGTKFNFKFKPRYGINAQTPASIVYDYYNPEAQAVNAPIRFTVR